jgi:hypothetical protein
MSCFATVFRTQWPRLQCWGFPHTVAPFCTMWFRKFTQNVTQTGHIDSTEHDTQPISYLISRRAIPYRTRGGTCCPGVSTPKIRSLAYLSMTSHITWWNPSVSTIPTLLKPQHQSTPWSNHISIDGRPSLTKTQVKLNITKDGKTCTTPMTAWLSKIQKRLISMNRLIKKRT